MFNLFKRTKAYSQKDMRDMYKRVFSTYEGKAVLLHILSIANVDETTFTMGDHDYTILKEGQRRLALNILKMAQDDDDKSLRVITDIEETNYA